MDRQCPSSLKASLGLGTFGEGERRGEKPIEKEVIDGKEYGRKKHGIRQEESIGVTLRGYRRAGEEHRRDRRGEERGGEKKTGEG